MSSLEIKLELEFSDGEETELILMSALNKVISEFYNIELSKKLQKEDIERSVDWLFNKHGSKELLSISQDINSSFNAINSEQQNIQSRN